jgi:ribosome-binding protein aMBF1 (putative translation factor)
MTRSSRTELKHKTLDARTTTDRADYDRVNAEARLAAEVGEHIHDAREAAGLSQREPSRRMGTNQATMDRLESGGVGATLPTLQRVATALSSRRMSNSGRQPEAGEQDTAEPAHHAGPAHGPGSEHPDGESQ